MVSEAAAGPAARGRDPRRLRLHRTGVGMGAVGGAAAVLGVEVCAPLLMLCWLCCWPDDGSSDNSSEKHPRKPVLAGEAARRRGGGLARGGSAVSLHLPGTSGVKKQPLSAHRSHEEIRSRRKSQHEPREDAARYHSAPSVIDEVLHRRDWERSTKELHIPLKPAASPGSSGGADRGLAEGAPWQRDLKSDEEVVGRPCKKHYANIKSSRNRSEAPTRKELAAEETKDEDLSERTSSLSNFYIGDSSCVINKENIEHREKKTIKVKELKQSLNESLKCRERPRYILGPLTELQVSGALGAPEGPDVDRSGAVHHFDESRSSYCDTPSVPYPPLSAEPAEGSERGCAGAGAAGAACGGVQCATRARHASAGDVLAPLLRPHSAALSESDLDLELECCDEPPPAYDELQMLAIAQRKETAI